MKKTVSSLLAAALVATTNLSSDAEATAGNKQNTYVLVHGAWQAPYVWEAVEKNLTDKGNKVVVVQLPGHGSDSTPAHTLSLYVYRDKVIEAIAAADGKVILVGHSMGGMVITHVAEQVPSLVNKLVYLGAFLPASGQALTDLAFSDPGSKLGPSLVPSKDQLTIDVKKKTLLHYLFPMVPKPQSKV